MAATPPLRVGYVPEHFSTPIHFARKHFGLDADLRPFPSGTGHMITALRAGDLDVGIGLTEGWVAGLGKEPAGHGGYDIVGTYVETPLCWAISSGYHRTDVAAVADLRGSRLGVSRIGSGSYVMGFVLADQQGWLKGADADVADVEQGKPYRDVVVLNTFDNLRNAVNTGTADFFMWEHFTSKRYYDNHEIKRVGEIYTPWSSWKIVAASHLTTKTATATTATTTTTFDPRLQDLFTKLDQGIDYFNAHHDEAVQYISTALDYSAEDARAWLDTVRFPVHTRGVSTETIDKCIDVLQKAGVLTKGQGALSEAMIAEKR